MNRLPIGLLIVLYSVGASSESLVTSGQIGYQLNLGSKNKISLSRVASVPLGKLCTTMSVTDPYRTVYIVADRLLATMDPNPKKPGETFTRPNQVWASCTLSVGVTVSWLPTTQNTDNTPITDLEGYRIVYGTSPESMTKFIEIRNPSITSYVLEGLYPATWYFAVRAFNKQGKESVNSNVAIKMMS